MNYFNNSQKVEEIKTLVIGNINDKYLQNHDTQLYLFQSSTLNDNNLMNQPGNFRVIYNVFPDGHTQIDMKLSKALIYAEVEVLMRVLHIFTEGMPEYDPSNQDKPNNYNENLEDQPTMELSIVVDQSLVCMDKFTSQQIQDMQRNKQNLKMIVANVEKLQYVLTFSRIDQVKYELYEKLKEFKQTQKKISNLDNPIKKIEYFNDNADQTLHQIDEAAEDSQKGHNSRLSQHDSGHG